MRHHAVGTDNRTVADADVLSEVHIERQQQRDRWVNLLPCDA